MERQGVKGTYFCQPDESAEHEELELEYESDNVSDNTINTETNMAIEWPDVDTIIPWILPESEHTLIQPIITDQYNSIIESPKNFKHDIAVRESTNVYGKFTDSLNIAEQKQYTLSNLKDSQLLFSSKNENTEHVEDLFDIEIATPEEIDIEFCHNGEESQREIVTENNIAKVKYHTYQIPCTSRQASINEQVAMSKRVDIYSNRGDNCHFQMQHNNPEEKAAYISDSSNPSNKFLCKICGHETFSNAGLKSHMTSAHDGQIFECYFCKMSFEDLSHLRKHLKESHTNRKFSCCFCSWKFSTLNKLKYHISNRHQGNICPQKCKRCKENAVLHQKYLYF